ncbi:hypothetical protein LCGC14_2515610 [marine sediment metagenome]|uniref:Uncharacterized protein n=1 Tax=marine sediment metagenome TaxID=412755 RepID=A0A0F9D9F8_9ZZZZ
MAVTAASVDVADVAIACNENDVGGTRLIIRNSGGQARVCDLGPAGVVFGEGFELDAGDTVMIKVKSGEVIYAVSDAQGTTLKILRT